MIWRRVGEGVDGEAGHGRVGWMRVLVLHTQDGRRFLTRWRLVSTRAVGVYLHHIDGPDPGLDLHDHPWSFWSLILWGGYTEEVESARLAPLVAAVAERWPETCTHGIVRAWRAGSVHRIRPDEAHRITDVRPRTWTIIVTGRKFRSWGFFQPDGWHDFRTYDYRARRPLEQTGA